MKFKTLCIILLVVLMQKVTGQHNSTTYYMDFLPQSAVLNPAIQPVCNFYLSLPSVSFELKNNAVNFNDVVYYREDLDMYITPFDTMATVAEQNLFIDNFKALNTFGGDIYIDAFGFGFRANKSFISFSIAEKFEGNLDYPADFLTLLVKGNAETNNLEMSGLGFRNNIYQEISLGISTKIDNNLTYGFRGKLLFGQMNLQVKKQDITLEMDPFNTHINSSFEIVGSNPFINIYTTGNDFDSVKIQEDIETQDLLDAFLLNKKNIGFGFDLGVIYNSDKISFSASVVDLGMILWRNNTFNLTQDAEFDFSGIEIDFFDKSESDEDTTFFDMLIDSVFNAFELTSTEGNGYSTMLSTKILFGFNYQLTKRVGLGVLSYNQIYRSKIFPRVTLSANFKPFRWLSTSFSYSILNEEYYNMGFGLSFKSGPFNVYFVGDTYPMVFTKGDTPIPLYLKGFRFQCGMNIVFGTGKILKSEKDTPLLLE